MPFRAVIAIFCLTMNRCGAEQIEEGTGTEPELPRAAVDRMTPVHDSPVQAGRVLEPSVGATFFVWQAP